MKSRWWILGLALAATTAGAADIDVNGFVAQGLAPNASGLTKINPTALYPMGGRNLTTALAAARLHFKDLTPENQVIAARLLQRPTDSPGDCFFGTSCVYLSGATTLVSGSGRFRIHYVTTTGDTNIATTAYAQSVADVMDAVYAAEVTTLGYAEPPSDGTAGGDALYDVYLANIGAYGIYGYAAPESPATGVGPGAYTSYLVLDNDYSSAEYGYASPTAPLQVTAAHEFFHAIQFGYDADESAAFMEQSSTWMESIVYPNVPAAGNNDNYQYIGEPWVDVNGDGIPDSGDTFTDINGNGKWDAGSVAFPYVPLDAFDVLMYGIQYGRFLWPQYLSETYGNNVMRLIWTRAAATQGADAYAATDSELQSRGSSLAADFHKYAVMNYNQEVGTVYANAGDYPRTPMDLTTSSILWPGFMPQPVSHFASSFSPSLTLIKEFGYGAQAHLSTVYERINGPSGTFRFAASGGSPRLTMLSIDAAGAVVLREDVTLTNGAGDWTWAAPAGGVAAVAVISNAARTTDGMEWSLTGGNLDTHGSQVSSSANGIGGVSGLGSFDWLALSAGALVLLRRRKR